ncbi:hypothetical protein HU200_012014 [Digitaria exilis]|uniref:chalcone synthase n=1 Tax=Digitaria exilis TaxID=1010633 RepID=A0A835FFD4_9POAL|nr:hypothetical protein HU200_012014 [Digitaria exilis]
MEIAIQSSKTVKPAYGGSRSWDTQAMEVVPLTAFDELVNEYMSSIHAFYPPAPSNAAMEEGLAKALAEHREWAGKLTADRSTGRRAILLNDAGARFIEATADVALEAVMPLLTPSSALVQRLHPSISDGTAEELMLVQITRFACGSLVLGHTMHHAVGDGFAICQCLLAWGQATRGVAIDPLPVHDRESFFVPRDPPKVEFEHRGVELTVPEEDKNPSNINDDDASNNDVLVTHKLHFSREFISDLKSAASAGMPRPYSLMQCLMAHLWRCITMARGLTGDKSMIRKRHMLLTEEILEQNPSLCAHMAPSLDARHDIVVAEVPKLGRAAAEVALKEWGRPRSQVTHLVFCTYSGVDMPGADYQLTRLLGLRPSVSRLMLYQQGCFAGGTVLRVAKDLAENNRGARVLVVCSEINAIMFRGPSEAHLDSLVGQTLFGDGAAAVIVGADADEPVERPLFQLVSARQSIVPDSEGAIEGHLREAGLTFHLLKDVPGLIAGNIERALEDAFAAIGVSDWNSIFWVVHPGGPAILDKVEATVGLDATRMRASRHVLSEYGNMSSACVLFILDEVRRRSLEDGCSTTGEGMDWGVLFGFGPGLTMETVVLRSAPITGGPAA